MKRAVLLLLVIAACGDDANTVYYDSAHATADTFWNYPWPSDKRLGAHGAPDMTGFPNPRNVPILTSLMSNIPERRAWPAMSTGYFRFTAPIPERSPDVVMAAGPVYLVDIDPASPERGRTVPVVA